MSTRPPEADHYGKRGAAAQQQQETVQPRDVLQIGTSAADAMDASIEKTIADIRATMDAATEIAQAINDFGERIIAQYRVNGAELSERMRLFASTNHAVVQTMKEHEKRILRLAAPLDQIERQPEQPKQIQHQPDLNQLEKDIGEEDG